jgi:hypothetical protein
MVDEMLQQEHREFEALLSLFDKGISIGAEQDMSRTEYGSDDEEFDRNCLEVVWATEISRTSPSRSSNGPRESYTPMDIWGD